MHNQVAIKGVSSESMELLLGFCYTGEITVTETNVDDLLFASDLLGITHAKESCSSFLQDQLSPENCIGSLQLGEKHCCDSLCAKAMSYINTNFKSVKECSEILYIDAQQLKYLLESDDINVDEEFEILQVIFKWVEYDPRNRRKMLPLLLPAVKLCFIPPRKLRKVLKKKFIQGDIVLQNMIEESLICHCECASIPMRKSCATWLYVVGGERSFMKETRSIEYFDCERMEWKGSINLAGSRVACAVTTLDGNLYVIGGRRQGAKLKTVQRYDPSNGRWTNLEHLTKCQGEVQATVLNGAIYVAGGSCTGQATCRWEDSCF